MKRKQYSLESGILICLTVAVVITFVGVAIKTIVPAVAAARAENNRNQQIADATPSDTDSVDKPAISLDPNLSCESNYPEKVAVFASDVGDGFYTVYNDDETGYVSKTGDALNVTAKAKLSGKALVACSVSGEGLAAGLIKDDGYSVCFIDKYGVITESERVYRNETPVFIGCYDRDIAVIFTSEGESGKRVVFRLYRAGTEICERYANVSYLVEPLEIYRIGDVFTVFYRYKSAFSKGGGYATFSLSSISVEVTPIERSGGYDFLSVIPRNGSYAMLCSDVEGAFIMQLDENLARSEKYDLTDYAVLCGKLSYDGKNYFAFVGGDTQGKMFRFSDDLSEKSTITAYDSATEIADEFNTGGALLHLLKSDKGFYLTDTNGLFTKKVTKANAVPVALIRFGGSVAAVCNVCENETTTVYVAVFN